MAAQLLVAVVVIAFHRGILDGAVHALDLTIGPRMVRFGQAMFDPVGIAYHVEAHGPRIGSVSVSGLLCELDAVIGQDRMYAVGHGFQKAFKELPGRLAIGFLDQLCHREFAGAIDGHKEIEFALFGPDLGNVDVEEADRVALELLPLRLVTFDIRQARYSMPLQAPMQRRACQMRDRRLQRIEIVIQRQQRVPPERDDHGFLFFAENG